MTLQTVIEAKTQAKLLRKALAEKNITISHSQALELLALQQGTRDWNTLHAQLGESIPLQLNKIIKGRYMGQPFCGKLVSLAKKRVHYHVSIQLEQPIDTVTFDSFSNQRRYLRGVVNSEGESLAKTSNGVHHLVLDYR